MLRIILCLSFAGSWTIYHQLALRKLNKALLIFAELHKLFVIELHISSYVEHSLLSSFDAASHSSFCVSVTLLFIRNRSLHSVIR